MANTPATLVERTISDSPVTKEDIEEFVNRELTVLVAEMRRRLNETIEWPRVPLFSSSPVTDADFDPTGSRTVPDGVLSYSLTDGKLYVRRDGGSTHVAVV
jgi:hypothetical protein